ncbi:hypothetical protein AA106555_0066 [Neokomagataea thailandica NBRC 106555]|uniref:Uracil-DNA glycosylase-like domain-containing protein n=2 Tax=Neokomagataea TaxID=1223423 RepID=A0A4Y6V429_9PROT|nr:MULTISPECIES: hypothetical protein [Neokomagataea]QDH24819.1 hypothetical protein D5366_05845 [Neokomagataea tanensis]GBR50038.1 hypothetical protein AA106555_0066 [Neokomagataea thailandica NBRC 106555]
MTLAFPSEKTFSSNLAPSEGSPFFLYSPPPAILILNVDQTLPQKRLKEALEARGLLFGPASTTGQHARFSKATATVNALLSHPHQLNQAKASLQHELQTLNNLQLVLTIGLSSHILLMEALGIALNRQTFHMSGLARLPDGLLSAHLPTPSRIDQSGQRLLPFFEAFDALLPDIQQALFAEA